MMNALKNFLVVVLTGIAIVASMTSGCALIMNAGESGRLSPSLLAFFGISTAAMIALPLMDSPQSKW
jgi:hypothetical protein